MKRKITKENVSSELLSIIIAEKTVGKDKIKPESNLVKDLKFDTVEMIILVSKIEEVFGIEFKINDLDDIQTVRDYVKLIHKMVNCELVETS
jgi:acyl carrier protein